VGCWCKQHRLRDDNILANDSLLLTGLVEIALVLLIILLIRTATDWRLDTPVQATFRSRVGTEASERSLRNDGRVH
jgi:hypothetical protein